MATGAPSAAKAAPMLRPIPRDAPVTTTTLPVKRPIMSHPHIEKLNYNLLFRSYGWDTGLSNSKSRCLKSMIPERGLADLRIAASSGRRFRDPLRTGRPRIARKAGEPSATGLRACLTAKRRSRRKRLWKSD
jgi:hypothetical protein